MQSQKEFRWKAQFSHTQILWLKDYRLLKSPARTSWTWATHMEANYCPTNQQTIHWQGDMNLYLFSPITNSSRWNPAYGSALRITGYTKLWNNCSWPCSQVHIKLLILNSKRPSWLCLAKAFSLKRKNLLPLYSSGTSKLHISPAIGLHQNFSWSDHTHL